MNKQELVSAIASNSGLSKADSEKALNATTEAIKSALVKGESIQLIGFGTFSISERAARKGRNPQTGKEIQIAAKKVAKFKPGKALGELIN
ncbi:MAG: HU family DNA-binding protein [Salinivirgaceae bacterium]|jgi:nucleoid DNA-binding protein|nr:HU family DNA-binding protein [Salinivirgaceae bacterium]